MYRTIIIEDDPMVASINKQYIEIEPLFLVCKIFKNGLEALNYLKKNQIDLIILDYYTPLMNGEEFINRLHGLGMAPDIIMVTSANDTDIVSRLLSRGIIDYLVKPFEYSRFKTALDKFLNKRQFLERSDGSMKQTEIDRLLTPANIPVSSAQLTKGLNESTLHLIRSFLKEHPSSMFTNEQIAEQVHLSRITIRRYTSYMVDTNEIISMIDYQTGGRPSIKYRYAKSD